MLELCKFGYLGLGNEALRPSRAQLRLCVVAGGDRSCGEFPKDVVAGCDVSFWSLSRSGCGTSMWKGRESCS